MDIYDTNKSLIPASTRLILFLSWLLSLYIMNTSIYSGPLSVVSNMDENIDSNYEDNVFSHVAAKIWKWEDRRTSEEMPKRKENVGNSFYFP